MKRNEECQLDLKAAATAEITGSWSLDGLSINCEDQ